MTRVVLHIDRLVLRGVERGDAEAVSAALQAELHTLLSVDGGAALREQAGVHRVRAGQVALHAGADAAALGSAVAGRIAGVVTPAQGAAHRGAR